MSRDSLATYSVSGSTGCSSVTVSGSTVNFTPNIASTSYSITINDGHGGVTQSGVVTASVVNTPSITSPTSGSTGVGSSATMTASAPTGTGIFSSISSYTATWELYTNASYTAPAAFTQTVTSGTSVTFTGLSVSTTYYVRTKYTVNGTDSSWNYSGGNGYSFTTKSSFIPSTQQAQLLVSTGSGLLAAASDYFGGSVALSSDGNTALIGCNGRNLQDTVAAGAAYVFTRSGTTWNFQTLLQIPGPGTGDFFGNSVALSSDGNTALIGCNGRDTASYTNAGAAYVFTRSGAVWNYRAELAISMGIGLSPGALDNFGVSVALSGDGYTALIGCTGRDTASYTNVGAAYVFIRSGTTLVYQKELLISSGGSGLTVNSDDQFGCSVALSGDGNTALIGSYWRDVGNMDTGAAYVFIRSGTTWTYQKELLTTTDAGLWTAKNDYFGRSVALSGDGNTALIGCIGITNFAGAAYVFIRSGTTWTYQKELLISSGSGLTPVTDDQFGYSVALSSDGNTALIGCPNRDTGATNAGAAYVFTRSGSVWSFRKELLISTGGSVLSAGTNDYFAQSVALGGVSGDTALIGCPNRDTGTTDDGATYIYA